MGVASFARCSFLSGEWSKTSQGRFDQPAYAASLNVCLNSFPTEQGAWTRRGGTVNLNTTRGGNPGRTISFAINETNPYSMEFTDGYLRFRSFGGQAVGNLGGIGFVTTNDAQAVSAISSANPAVVTVPAAWTTGTTVFFQGLGTNNPRLQNRLFTITNISGATFSLQDAITGANIDGSTLGAFVSGKVARVLEIATSYVGGSWAGLISVQTEKQAVLLNGTQPQVLTLTSDPTTQADATFTLNPVDFIDGPYLDPFPGSQVTYSTVSGNITLTFAFQAYSATTSYNAGDYVTSGGQGYVSIAPANEGNTPSSSPTYWKAVNGGAPVGPSGFTAADIGRHIRLFNEPPLWSSGSSYSSGNIVTYNDAYWQYIGSTNPIPGTDVANWVPVSGSAYALWTWGRILSISGSGLISPVSAIGSMAGGGGLAAAFNGTVAQNLVSSAQASNSVTNAPNWAGNGVAYTSGAIVFYNGSFYECYEAFSEWVSGITVAFVEYEGSYFEYNIGNPAIPPGSAGSLYFYKGSAAPSNTNVWSNIGGTLTNVTVDCYVGQNFSSSAKEIQQVTVYPSNDQGFAVFPFISLVINLWASNSLPSSPSNGTLIGTTTLTSNQTASVSIPSNSTASWDYVWIELVAVTTPNTGGTFTQTLACAQVEFFTANVNNGSVVTLQLAGEPLIYTAGTVVYTWQAGAYSNTTGWPTCGCYHEGRLWLAGAYYNRLDSSQVNDIFNMAPTEIDGTVTDNDGITAVFNSDSINTIFWMIPDAQGIVCGTDGGEWLIQATTAGLPLTPTNIQAHRVTKTECAFIEPVRTEHTIVAVQRRKRKIFEYFADIFSGKFTAPNLTEKARHLTENFVEEVRYQQEINPTIWARCGDGSLIGAAYRRDTLMTSQGPTFIGWHRHQLGSGRLVESIAIGPSQGGTLDSLVMVTNDPGTNIRHVELLADMFEETDNLQDAWMLDDAVIPSSYAVGSTGVTFNGLWHLNGKLVTVFAAGLDCGDFTVAAGSIGVPYGDGISEGAGGGLFTQELVNSFTAGMMPAVIGFNFNSDGQLTRPMTPQESGARSGPALAKKRRFDQYGMLIVTANGGVLPETSTPAGLQVGTNFNNLNPANFRLADDVTPLAYGVSYSGVHWDTLDDDASFDGMLCWRATRPWPATIAAIESFGETRDK